MKKPNPKVKLSSISKITLLVILGTFCFTSCDDDFSEVGSNIVDNPNFEALLFDSAEIQAKTRKLERVQTNNLSGYSFGVYNDAVYGKKTSNFVTQLSLSNTNPEFYTDPVLDSVVLNLPYFSTVVGTEEDQYLYKLDSVYGDSPIKLSVYESTYFLRDIDPENDYEPQVYYSDQTNLFEQYLNPTPILEIPDFKPTNNPVVYFEEGEEEEIDTIYTAPALRVNLPTAFFQEKILNQQDNDVLLSNANFRNYLRGLYFKAESADAEGNLTYFNFNAALDGQPAANITLYFKTHLEEDYTEQDSAVSREFRLNFGPAKVNLFENEYQTAPQDEKLYLKGGEGSIAEIDLFKDQNQLDSLREKDWLINEANLLFYVDENQVPDNQKQPERIFVYDIKNEKVLGDYMFDVSANENDPLTSRTVHLGRLSKDEDGNRFYKIRVTNLVNNIINKDSTNTRLGVSVSQNVNISSLVKADFEDQDIDVEKVPSTHAISPEGTVLYGPNAALEAKKLKLNIFYTEAK